MQSTLLLNNLRQLHPTFRKVIRDTKKGNFEGHSLSHDRDAYTQMRFLIRQGGLLCEVLRVLALIVLPTEEEKIEMSHLDCSLPSAFADPDNLTGKNVCQTNFGKSYHIYQVLYHEPMPLRLETLDVITVYDVIIILETAVGRLSVLLPLYPVMLFRLDDDISFSSSSIESYGIQSSLGTAVVQKCKDAPLQELLMTEKEYIHKLNVMYEYVLQTAQTAPVLLKQVQIWMPKVRELRDFHLNFYTLIQVHKGSVPKLASLFFEFNDVIGLYKQWIHAIYSFPTTPAIVTSPDMMRILPLTSTPEGVNAHRLQPMQRLLRYPLLIKELMAGLDENNIKLLEAAHSTLHEISQQINEVIRAHEMQRLKNLLLPSIPDETLVERLQPQNLYQDAHGISRYIDDTGNIVSQKMRYYFFDDGILFLPLDKNQRWSQNPKTSSSSSGHGHGHTRISSVGEKVSSTLFRTFSLNRSKRKSTFDYRYVSLYTITRLVQTAPKEIRLSNHDEEGQENWEDLVLDLSIELVVKVNEMLQQKFRPTMRNKLMSELISIKIKYQEEISWLLLSIHVQQFQEFDAKVQEHLNQVYTPHKFQYFVITDQFKPDERAPLEDQSPYARLETDEDMTFLLQNKEAKLLIR